MSKRIKKILIGIGAVAALLILILAGMLMYLGTGHAQRVIQARINSAIPGQVVWDDMDFSLPASRIEIKNLRINGPPSEGADHREPLIAVNRIFLDLSVFSLLKKIVKIEAAAIEGPRVWLAVDRDGTLNITRAFPSSPEKPAEEKPGTAPPLIIRIEKFTISDGEIRYEKALKPAESDEPGKESLEFAAIRDINLTVTRADLAERTASLSLSAGGEINMAGVQTGLSRFQLETILDKGRLDPLKIDLAADAGQFNLTGNVQDVETAPLLDLALDLTASLEQVQKTFDLKQGISGPVRIRLTVQGRVDDPAADIQVSYGGGELAGNTVKSIELDCGMKERQVSIRNLSSAADTGDVQVSGQINLAPAFPQGFLSPPGDFNAISYAFSMKRLNAVLDKLPVKAGLGGAADAALTLEGTGISLEKLMSRGKLTLSAKNLSVENVLSPTDADLSADIELSDQTLRLNPLNLNTGGTRVAVEGDYHLPSGKAGLRLSLDAPDLSELLSHVGIADLKGAVNLNADISVSLKQPSANLRLNGDHLAFKDIAIGAVQLEAALDETGILKIASLNLKNQGSEIRTQGDIHLFKEGVTLHPDLPLNLVLAFKNIQAKNFMNHLDAAGTVDMDLTLKGDLKTPDAALILKGKGLEFQKNRIGDLAAELHLEGGSLTVTDLRLQNKQSGIQLNGTAEILGPGLKPLKDPGFNLKLDKTMLVLNDFSSDLKGTLGLEGEIQGRLSDPSVRIVLRGDRLEAGGNRIGDLNAALRLARGILSADPIKIKNRRSALEVSGTVQVLNPGSLEPLKDPVVDIKLSGEPLFLEDFLNQAQGKLRLNGNIKGSLSRPKGKVVLIGENIVFSEQPVERIELTADLDGEKAHIRPLRVVLSQNQEALRAGGWVSLFNKTYDLKAVSEGISFKHIQAVQKQALGEGMIRLDLSGKGNFANPHLSGEIRMTDLQLKGKPVDDVRFTVDLKDHLARISGGLNFNMDAQYHLESKDFSTELRFDSTDLIPYFRLGGQTELSGILSGVIRAQGNAAAPDQIQGLADISRLEVFMEKTPLIQSQELTAAYKNKGFSVPGIRLALLEKGYVTISGTGNLGGNLNIMARGEIPVEVLQFFVKDIQDAAGQVGLSADIKGTLGEPDIQARIDLKDIGMTLPALSQKLHHLNGGITIDPHGLGIKDVAGQLDEGRFNLSGGVQLDHFKPVHADLSIHADRLPIRMPDTLDLLLNTDLTVRGSADKALISGEIVMIEGNYTRDVKMNLLGMVSQKTRKQAPDEKSSNPALKNIALEIVLKHRNAFVVDNNLALMNLKPSIRIGGTAAQPRVDGRAEVTSGTITFQKKEFEIKKGVIDFLNPYKIEPTIDIQGEIPIRKWIVSLLISGTPDDLRFRLSSDPPEEDADILSLIALGKTTKELISGQGGTSGSTTQMLADILASNLQQNLKSATGLDSVELKYRDGADGQDAGVQVTVGKELSRRLSVKYGVENKDGLSVQKATTEYKFFENLIMSAFQDTQGIFGGELIFRLEFR